MGVVLDASIGKPASQVQIVVCQKGADGTFTELSSAMTDPDGRCSSIMAGFKDLDIGTFRVAFYVEDYFRSTGRDCFYPVVEVGTPLPLLIPPYSSLDNIYKEGHQPLPHPTIDQPILIYDLSWKLMSNRSNNKDSQAYGSGPKNISIVKGWTVHDHNQFP